MAEKKKKERSPNLGGARPGAGRPRKIKKLSNYDTALKLLDDNLTKALNVVIEGLTGPDLKERRFCAELLLKKALPDRLDLKNQYAKESAKALKDMKGLSDEELERIVNGG